MSQPNEIVNENFMDNDEARVEDEDEEMMVDDECLELTEQELEKDSAVHLGNKIFMEIVDRIDKHREKFGFKPHPKVIKNRMLGCLRRQILMYARDSKHGRKLEANTSMLVNVDNQYAHNFNLILAYETARLHLTKTKEEVLKSATLVAEKLKIEENTFMVQLLDNLQKHYNEISPQSRIMLFSKVLLIGFLVKQSFFSKAYGHPCTRRHVRQNIVEVLVSIPMDKNFSPSKMSKCSLRPNKKAPTAPSAAHHSKHHIGIENRVRFDAPTAPDMVTSFHVNYPKSYGVINAIDISEIVVVLLPIWLPMVKKHGLFATW